MNPSMLLQTNMQEITNNGKITDKENLLDNNLPDKDIGTNFKDFLSKLLTQAEKDSKGSILQTSETIKTEDSDINIPNIINLNKLKNSDKKDNLSNDNDSTFNMDELLKLTTFLKTNGLKGSFPTDTKKIDTILNDEKALNDFKNIKNFKELVEVADKYDIKIKKFDFTQIDSKSISYGDIEKKIDKAFVQLDKNKKNSFEDRAILSEKILQKKQNDATIANQPKNTPHQNKSLLENIIQEKTKQPINLSQNLDQPKQQDLKNISLANTKNIQINNSKSIEMPTLQSYAKIVPDNKSTKKVKTNHKQHLQKNDIKIEQNNIQNNLDIDNLTQTKELKSTRENDIKKVSSFDNSKTFNKIVASIKTETNIKNKHIKTDTNHIGLDTNIAKDKKSTLSSNNNFDTNTQTQGNVSSLKHSFENKIDTKQVNIKDSLNNFTSDLKEQIDNYKPPIMRVKMTLNPKDLGEVNVNLVSRGNTLQINISSNTNTMAIFTQNQAEFKNALVNMGFTNLNMNFSDQRGSKEQQKGESSHNITDKIEDETYKEEITNLELIIPKYT